MPSRSFVSRMALLSALIALLGSLSPAQTRSSTTKKKAAISTAKRTPTKSRKVSSANSSRRGRTAVASRDDSSSESSVRHASRRVVVNRRLVHGRWVKTTQIVHTDPAPTYQTHPDTDRYQQIQQALAQKGYFKGAANGQWGDDSVAALKQYQTERSIPNDGKITALSLIGLGLGPNRETASAKTDPTLHN